MEEQPVTLEEEVASGSTNAAGASNLELSTSVSDVHLVLISLDQERHVRFHEGIIDNEGMNRRKSKCCCIYRKPYKFGESSSSSDDECEHCCGHPEMRVRNRLRKQQQRQQQQQQQQQQQPQQQQQQQQPQQCKCHAAATQQDSLQDTEVAGDSGSVKAKAEQPSKSHASLNTPSTQAVQP